MYLVTKIKTTTEFNEDTDELDVTRTVEDAHVETGEAQADLVVRRVRAQDHRVQGVRVFALSVDTDGTPQIGAELT